MKNMAYYAIFHGNRANGKINLAICMKKRISENNSHWGPHFTATAEVDTIRTKHKKAPVNTGHATSVALANCWRVTLNCWESSIIPYCADEMLRRHEIIQGEQSSTICK